MNGLIEYEDVTVAEIAVNHPSSIYIFNKYQIDYCCNGKINFRTACENVGADYDLVRNELIQAEASSAPGKIHFENWDASLLSDFIVQHHHHYVKKNIPFLQELLERVCEVHSDREPELITLKDTFKKLSDELLSHMNKEEAILFPGIKRLFDSNESESYSPTLRNLHAPMTVMEDEHTQAGDLIKSIRMLTNSYTTPPEACPTYKVAFKSLQEFDQDLMQHIHLENNVLFEKVKTYMNSQVI